MSQKKLKEPEERINFQMRMAFEEMTLFRENASAFGMNKTDYFMACTVYKSVRITDATQEQNPSIKLWAGLGKNGPKQKSKETNKRFVFNVRLTLEENKLLLENAGTSGMNKTDYSKFCTMGKPPRTKIATPKLKPLIKQLGGLGKIRSNLDQIAKGVNDKSHYSDNLKERDIPAALKSLRALADQTQKILVGGCPMANYDLELLNKLVAEFKPIGDDLNEIAKTMNDKSYYSINIKETVISGVLKRFIELSDQTLKLLQGDHTGGNEGERQPVGELPPEHSGQ